MSIAAQCLHGAGLCAIPKPDNDYRPLALRHGPLAFISSLLIAVKVVTILAIALTPTPAELSTITSSRILQLTNQERTAIGLNALTVNAKLSEAARQKGEHMLQEDYFAHISPSGVTPWFWINKVGYSYKTAGENLAIDFIEAEDVVAAWMASPSHKANMLHSGYTETGIAVVTGEFQGGTSTIVVHMFGTPTLATATVTEPTPVPKVEAQTTQTPTPVVATPTPPAPTPESSPIPTPDIIPPATPRIATVTADTTYSNEVLLKVSGEPSSTAHLMINGQNRGQALLDENGEAEVSISIFDLPQGDFTVQALAVDAANNASGLSERIILSKSSEGEEKLQSAITFLLSPEINQPTALVLASSDYKESAQVLKDDKYLAADQALINMAIDTLEVAEQDSNGNLGNKTLITLSPQFFAEDRQQYTAPTAKLNQSGRLITILVVIVVMILLSLTILINIRIQRPSIIAHASLVILIAAAILLV